MSPRAAATDRRTDRAHVDDALGQRILRLLWRRLAADDAEAIEARRAELETLARSLGPRQSAAALARLRPGGDLHGDASRRLHPATLDALRAILAASEKSRATRPTPPPAVASERAVTAPQTVDRGTSDRGTANRGTDRQGVHGGSAPTPQRPTDGAASSADGAQMPVTIRPQFEIPVLRRVARFAAFTIEVTVELQIEMLTDLKGVVKVGIGMSPTAIGAEIGASLFGASGAFKVKQEKDGSSVVSFAAGVDELQFQVNLSPLTPVSIELPEVIEIPLDFARDLPQLGLSGSAMMVAKISVEVHPNYAQLANTGVLRAARATLRTGGVLLRSFGSRAVQVVSRSGSLARVASTAIIRGGRGMLGAILARVGPSVGRLVGGLAAAAGRTTAAAARGLARPVLRRLASRLLNRAAVIIIVIERLKELDAQQNPYADEMAYWLKKSVTDIEEHFASGYAWRLWWLTQPGWKDRLALLRAATEQSRYQQWAIRPPEALGWDDPSRIADSKDLLDWLYSDDALRSHQRPINHLEDDWGNRATEAARAAYFGYFAFREDDAFDTLRSIWRDEASAAGASAAVQDVVAFIVVADRPAALAFIGDEVVPATDGDAQWDAVAKIHREIYGPMRVAWSYPRLIHLDRVDIMPFFE